MRIFGLFALLAALAVPALHAQSGDAVRAVFFDAAVPAAFSPGEAVVVGPGVTVQSYSDLDAGRFVAFVGYGALSPVRRFAFRHGIGISRSTPHDYERVSVDALPVARGLAASATSAFRVTDSDGSTVGTVVRGCDGDWCYHLAAQGPAVEGATPYAALLDGVRARR